MYLLRRFVVNCIAVAAGALLLPGIHIENSFFALMVVTLVLSLFNTFLKPLLILITIPITIFTFGLFLLVINAFVIMLAADLIASFQVVSFLWALAFSFVISIVNSLFRDTRQEAEKMDY